MSKVPRADRAVGRGMKAPFLILTVTVWGQHVQAAVRIREPGRKLHKCIVANRASVMVVPQFVRPSRRSRSVW